MLATASPTVPRCHQAHPSCKYPTRETCHMAHQPATPGGMKWAQATKTHPLRQRQALKPYPTLHERLQPSPSNPFLQLASASSEPDCSPLPSTTPNHLGFARCFILMLSAQPPARKVQTSKTK